MPFHKGTLPSRHACRQPAFYPPSTQQKEESVSHDNLCSPLSTESTSDAKQPQDKKVSDAVMPETATVANQDTDPSGIDPGVYHGSCVRAIS